MQYLWLCHMWRYTITIKIDGYSEISLIHCKTNLDKNGHFMAPMRLLLYFEALGNMDPDMVICHADRCTCKL